MLTDEKLDALKRRKNALAEKIAKIEAAKSLKARKEDTRLKILLGAAIIADTNVHPETRVVMEGIVKRAITAERDRDFLKGKGWF